MEHIALVAVENEMIVGFGDIDKIITHASITARSFFEHRGYQIVKEQQVKKNNIILVNYIMEKYHDCL